MLDKFDTSDQSYVIVATHFDDQAFESYLRAINVGFKRLSGSWEGKPETSWIVNAKDWRELYTSRYLAKQETFLHLGPVASEDDPRPALLQYNNNYADPSVFLGYLWKVSKEVALKHSGWTRDGDQYYVAAPTQPE